MGHDYKACVQLAKDYLENKVSNQFESVLPTYSIGTTFCDLNDLFSNEVNLALHEALVHFEKKVPGFVSNGAILSAVESRAVYVWFVIKLVFQIFKAYIQVEKAVDMRVAL
jgi:uncharacterized FAD-dependent dehydrogenase